MWHFRATQMTDKLIEQIKEQNPNLDINKTELAACFRSRQLGKNETLLSFHSVCRRYYFVNKGSLRIFFLKNGEEYTSWFAFENYFFTELESYTNQNFSQYRTQENVLFSFGFLWQYLAYIGTIGMESNP